MNINLNEYKVHLPYIKKLIDEGKLSLTEMVGLVSLSKMVPCIVVCYYIGNIRGFDKEVNDKIEALKQFYDVKTVTLLDKENV